MSDDFPYADSTAARMLSAGLERASNEEGRSVRQIGRDLDYKQAVVLSHMANGRVPIPIDRAEDIAATLHLNPGTFLQAVVKQRHPKVSWGLLSHMDQNLTDDTLSLELEAILGKSLKDLTKEHRSVIREVVAEPHPRPRWLSVHELFVVSKLREWRPHLPSEGFAKEEIDSLRAALSPTLRKD
tara:strand:- start:428 stop:979 length:552 start_codon:yes stop_codon:yes gene_type:complete